MISYLKGLIVEKHPTRLLIDVNGIGYEIHITVNCSRQVGDAGKLITMLTYLHVREDSLQLYGFYSGEERTLFLQLISIPGIGPKKALAILSSSNIDDFQKYIIEENLSALTSLSGIGRKTAQRLIIDLKEKLIASMRSDQPLSSDGLAPRKNLIEEAILAMVSLGYNSTEAQKAVQSVLAEGLSDITLEELIRKALRRI